MSHAALRTALAQLGYDYGDTAGASGVGVHYTPLDRVADVVRKALRPWILREDGQPRADGALSGLRLCDPALGGGVFLLEAACQLADAIPDGWARRREIVGNCLFGFDVDPEAVATSRRVLREFCEDPTLPEDFPGPNLKCADSLRLADAELPKNTFDVVLGNPPFLGGRKIRRVLGDAYFDFLTRTFAPGASGNADLCAYFFLLAERLVKPGGVCAFLATNSIGEGDSRKVGLDPLLARGAYIYDSATFAWTGSAAVHVTSVHLHFPAPNAGGGAASPRLPAFLDSRPVARIPSSLKALDVAAVAASRRFPENDALCFQGCVLAGKGFILQRDEALRLLERDPRNRDVVRPYFTGSDVFHCPDTLRMTPRRWVIDFHDWPLERAEAYPEPLEILRRRVSPQRRTARRNAHRVRWWLFGDPRPALRRCLERCGPGNRAVLQLRHAKYLAPTFVPTDAVYSESSVLFPFDAPGLLAVLNSAVHEIWARETSGSLGFELRYSPTDCLSTFPLPTHQDAGLGERLFATRRRVCGALGLGITALYDRYHDPADRCPELAELRELHADNDRRVLESYGWSDLAQRRDLHDFTPTARGIRLTFPDPLRLEILERLARDPQKI